MKDTTIIIPTRLGAKRLPNKPLIKINNVSIIIHVLNRAKESKIGEVFVATPDNEIFQIVKENGGEAILTSANHPSGTDRVYEAYSKKLANKADLIIFIGCRAGSVTTEKWKYPSSKTKIIHIDVDPSEIGKNIAVDVPIVGDVKEVLTRMNTQIVAETHPAWLKRIDVLKKDHPSLDIPETSKLLARQVVKDLSEETKGGATIVTGVGQHQMWAAQYLRFDEPKRWITSGGLGTMGYGFPAATGVQIAHPESLVIDVAGEASFLMNMQDN